MKGGHRRQWKSRDTGKSLGSASCVAWELSINTSCAEVSPSIPWGRGQHLTREIKREYGCLDAIHEGSIENEHQPLQNEATQSEMQMRRGKKMTPKTGRKWSKKSVQLGVVVRTCDLSALGKKTQEGLKFKAILGYGRNLRPGWSI